MAPIVPHHRRIVVLFAPDEPMALLADGEPRGAARSRSASVTAAVTLVTVWSLSRTPPCSMSRRASLRELARPSATTISMTGGRHAGFERESRQTVRGRAGKRSRCRVECRRGRLGAVAQTRRLGCQYFLRLVDLRVLQRLEPRNLLERQLGEHAQESPDVAILGVAPELPVIVGRQPLRTQPHGAARRLAHLGAGRGRDERRGEAE